jgi:hypothetical protein
MPRDCDCMGCRMARLMAEADDEDADSLHRRGMISYYMERFGMMYPEAVAMLDQERDLQWKAAIAAMERLHGLDEDDAVSHVLTHAVNQPERMQ